VSGSPHPAAVGQVSTGHLVQQDALWEAWPIDEDLITRDEVVALLFNVSDIAASLSHFEELLGGDDGEEEVDEG
jgi:hypothetical protein